MLAGTNQVLYNRHMKLRLLIIKVLVFGLLLGCSSKHRVKPKEPLKPKLTTTIVPTFSVDPTVLEKIPFAAIRGTSPEEIQSLILKFPFSNYQMVGVYSGFEVEYFCVDLFTDYIKNLLRSGQAWETHLSPYIFKHCRPGSVVIDIGAHIGTHSVQMSRAVGQKGKVIAIEPQPKSFRELIVNMTLNQADNIEYFWGAAGADHSRIELSPLNIHNEGGAGLGSGGTQQFVEVIPLDSLNLQNVSLIKIDVEGMEIEVLKGARETILREHPILLIEIMGGVRPELASEEMKQEIRSRIQFVEELGYEMIRLCELWDYLALPKGSIELQEFKETKAYRDHIKHLKRWASVAL
jgi:FkbM family methyltransferase